MDEIAELLREQDGVVARPQLLALGLDRTAVARMLRRGELVALHPGVYAERDGQPSWQQRAWAAVLHAGDGAALCLDSAVRAAEGPGRRGRDEGVVHVAVPDARRLRPTAGVQVHRAAGLVGRVQANASPPRVRYEEAVLDLAAAARSDLDAVAVLADACGSRRTTATRLLNRLGSRERVGRRAWLTSVLADVAHGTCSELEHGYRTRVVQPHALPAGRPQTRDHGPDGTDHRDVAHDDLGLVVELDGRAFDASSTQPSCDRDLDLEPNDPGATTLRIGYRQVFDRPCLTAARVAAVMQRLGWAGRPARCPECGTSDGPGRPDLPASAPGPTTGRASRPPRGPSAAAP
ncbi:hypothetical protein GCM10023340_44860 [Nocardioides marinquilinus]|uniref:AbiEi antitoxin N-terminal domain-containing protein n=1 Tax=Nocardioides marinquilinus TaxID=1210400 RepID=A0ABP9Q8E5_9ACTN